MAQVSTEDGSGHVKSDDDFESRTALELDLNPSRTALEPFIVDPVTARMARVRRIQDMLSPGRNQSKIIEAIYGVRKGGGTEYAKARDEYLSIVQFLSSTEGEI